MLRYFARAVYSLLALGVVGAIIAAAVIYWAFNYYGRDLPNYDQLADYQPPVTTRVQAGDGSLIAEFAVEKRAFVPIEAIPPLVINAFLASEDQNFYRHSGVDIIGVLRAVSTNIVNMGSGRRPVGASTITQQVAKNFLLGNELSYRRKIREAILAIRIEEALSKQRILELYLNEIYLGYGSYGVAAAALNYFGKSLNDLTPGEAAYIAALPKAPNNYHPITKHEAAVERRNYVIGRMAEDGYITAAEAATAMAEPLTVVSQTDTATFTADYFAEEVRRELDAKYGEAQLYKGGLSVRATLDPRLQKIADPVLRKGLIDYDRSHGWRGPLTTIETTGAWEKALAAVTLPDGIAGWYPAVVLSVKPEEAEIGFTDKNHGKIPLSEVLWARQNKEEQTLGPAIKAVTDVIKPGDVVLVEPVKKAKDGKDYPQGTFGLRQVPVVNGALVALDPHTGRVLAMSGGWSFGKSQFNRATQAKRQPGSAFKPFVYLAALDKGYTPSTLILDAPFVGVQAPGLPLWKPKNYTNKFYGPSTMRVGVEQSRNLMTVRLASEIGMDSVVDYARKFGIMKDMPPHLSMALGAGETTLLDLTAAYAMLVNGGKRITPTLIDRIQDRHGKTIQKHDTRTCEGCLVPWQDNLTAPELEDNREQVVNSATAYQAVSILEGVVQRGTGTKVKEVGKPLAGKTGTSNDSFDTWFIGFSPDLAVGVFVGFDTPATLGKTATGGVVAAPIFRDFMMEALKDAPATPFRVPPGIRLVRVNHLTGQLAKSGDKGTIFEAFKPGTEPNGENGTIVLDGGYAPGQSSPAAAAGGIY